MSQAKQHRDSNFELLRILAILFVIASHYYLFYGGLEHAASAGFVANYLSQTAFAFSKTCVNLFLVISGYFMVKSRKLQWGKVLTLLIMSVFYFGLQNCYSMISAGDISLFGIIKMLIPSSYYINIYCAVYIMSPFINKVMQSPRQTLTRMLLIALGLFCLWPNLVNAFGWVFGHKLQGTYPTSLWGDEGGLTFLNFTLCYMVGGYLRLYRPLDRISLKWRVAAVFALPMALAAVGVGHPGFISTDAFTGYDSVINITLTVLIFSVFEQAHIKYSPVINTLAKGTLVAYLVHNFFFDRIIGQYGFYDFAPQSGIGYVGASLACIVVAWILSVGVYFVMTAIFLPLIRRWKKTSLYHTPIYPQAETEN